MKEIAFTVILVVYGAALCGQDNKELAQDKKMKAIELMDNGQTNEAVKLLEEAMTLDPDNFEYEYEIGFAYYIKKDLNNAIAVFKKVLAYPDATDQCYQMLGNLYDIRGNSSKALKLYDEGLKRFPGSGRLYLEKGNVYWIQKKFNEALVFYEHGIETDPAYPSNYYRATLIYLGSTEKLWGMIYGEIFMNLERNSKRTEEISRLLYDSYKTQIEFTSDSSVKVSFSKNNMISLEDLKNLENFRLPYGVGVYEPTLLLAIDGEKQMDINSLDRVRRRFITEYYNSGHDKDYPNVLFDFQKQLLDSGHLEAYNHWILLKGEEDGFIEWQNADYEKWRSFVEWFENNRLILDQESKFSSRQY